jgi:hypothetical protein
MYPAFRPYDWTPELNQAVTAIRLFLRREPHLYSRVQYEYVIQRAFGNVAADPMATVDSALRQDRSSLDLCALLASPLGEAALAALALEFPGRVLLDLLPVAARMICAERRRQANVVGIIALVAGVGLMLRAVSGRKVA